MTSPGNGGDLADPGEPRLIVHFRFAEALDLDAGQPGSRAGTGAWRTSLLRSISEVDGVVSGWSHDFITADFPAPRALDVVALMTSGHLPPEFSVGVSSGSIHRVRVADALGLGDGFALRRARRLSEAALPGEVVVSDDVAKELGLRASSGAPRRALREELNAISLDLESPLRDGPEAPPAASGVPEGAASETPASVSGETIRRYRAEKIASKKEGGLGTCRASLALAVALAQLGRESEAILEALEGLSWARETNDARGERACALFLVQCADRRGDSGVARAWSEVASNKMSASEA